MKAPNSPRRFLSVPLTTAIVTVSLTVSATWLILDWRGLPVGHGTWLDVFMLDTRVEEGQAWRHLTSLFLERNWIALAFNLFWFWTFASAIEQRLGTVRTAAMAVLFAITAGASEFAFLEGYNGLGGVVFGMYGFLIVASFWDDRYEGLVDRHTHQLFLAWFLLCIIMTSVHLLFEMPFTYMANLAHASGWCMGLLLGAARYRRGVVRAAAVAAIPVFAAAAVSLCVFARPAINVSPMRGEDLDERAYRAYETGDYEEAIALYGRALQYNPMRAGWWHDLGAVYLELDMLEEAYFAFLRARRLEPRNPNYRDAVWWIEDELEIDWEDPD